MLTAQLHLLRRLWGHIGPRRRAQLLSLVVLMIVASFAELVSIGSVLPLLSVLAAPDRMYEHAYAQPFIHFFSFTKPADLLLPVTLAFSLAAILAGAMRLLLLWATTRLSYATGSDLSVDVYRRTLYQPYSVHIGRNSSELINGITGKTKAIINGAIMPTLTLMSSAFFMLVILSALIAINPEIALLSFAGFWLIYMLINRVTHSRLIANSVRTARESTRLIKSIQEGLGGIRDVLIEGAQEVHTKIYQAAELPLRSAQCNTQFISASPRYGMEALGMVLIAVLAYILASRPGGIETAIPVLAAMALGAQRLLPVLQQGYSAWSNIKGSYASLKDVLALLEQPLPHYASLPPPPPLPFRHSIALQCLSFRYADDAPLVLHNIELTIAKGERIGFIGPTGSGKSTLLDVVMRLLEPLSGSIEIDGLPIDASNLRAWQAHIAHVPQFVFLADASIEENIAFGVPRQDIDADRVILAARQARIADLIDTWSEGYKTVIGERGIRLSGGQRQRIGIARALYKRADVIVFDEATSALDTNTEQAIMRSIDDLGEDLTILMIAHRLSTLKGCTRIIELNGGGIRRVGTYQEIVLGETLNETSTASIKCTSEIHVGRAS